MKWYLSKLVAALAFMAICLPTIAQQDSIRTDATATDSIQKVTGRQRLTYEERMEKRQQRFVKLMPTHTRLQMYGDMGLVSVGIGWDYGHKARWETDILLGFIPKYSAAHAHLTLTLKQGFIPWDVRLGHSNFTVNPLTCGLYVTTILSDDDFWIRQPQRYPHGYYWYSTRLQTHIYLGQSINFEIPDSRRKNVKYISAFYELGSSDAYIISAATNKYLSIWDILRLSFGLKFRIM